MPNEKRSKIQVVLTFDVDGEPLWLSRDKTKPVGPVMQSQGAYGPKVAVPRILTLLAKYDIKATFFVPGWIAERYEKLCESILRGGAGDCRLCRGQRLGCHQLYSSDVRDSLGGKQKLPDTLAEFPRGADWD